MATQTTNLGLTKPAGTDKIRIAQINGNMDILDTKIGSVGDTALQAQVSAIENGIAIVSVGNAHAAISSGQFVYVRNHGTLPEGLYTANSAIAANATLSASNVTSTSAGGLNALSDQIANITSLNNVTLSLTSTVSGKMSVTEGGIYTYGRMYVVDAVLNITSEISTGEVKWATVNPVPKERITGIVLRTSNTTQVGVFQVTRSGDLWVNISTAVSSGAVSLCACGLTN